MYVNKVNKEAVRYWIQHKTKQKIKRLVNITKLKEILLIEGLLNATGWRRKGLKMFEDVINVIVKYQKKKLRKKQ